MSTVAPMVGNVDLAIGLVGWWKFDAGSGTTAADSSGNGNDLALTSPVWVSGKIGSALSFDGAGGSYGVKSNNGSLSVTIGTITVWAKPASLGGHQVLVSKEDYDNDRNGYNLSLRFTGAVDVEVSSGSGSSGTVSNGVLSNGSWTHVAWSWDGATHRIYLNGALDKSASQSQTPVSNVYDFYIARNASSSSSLYNGLLDGLRVYNRVLTDGEVSAIYGLGGT